MPAVHDARESVRLARAIAAIRTDGPPCGVDPDGTTWLFLVGKAASLHDTQVIAGGRPVRFVLLGHDVIRVDVPGGVQTIPATEACPPVAANERKAAVRLVAAAIETGVCGAIDCNGHELVAIHLATSNGVSSRLLVPVTRGREPGPTPSARVDEFYRSACEALEIVVPASFIPPERATLRLVLRDEAHGLTATVFSFLDPAFDGGGRSVVVAGSMPVVATRRGAATPREDDAPPSD